MNRTLTLVAIAAMLPIAACSSGSKPQAMTSEAPATPQPAVAAADQSFAATAAAGGLAEIQAAKLAQSKVKSPAIQNFAATMISDHTSVDQQLMQLAQQKGITLPTAPDEAEQQQITKLQGETGHTFVHDYLTGQVQDHQQMLQAFQTEASTGSDPDLKAFATQTLPILQSHLTSAQKLVGGSSTHHRHHHAATS